jgi:hypothetical protein
VNELYLRLAPGKTVKLTYRRPFFALAQLMRMILIDYARQARMSRLINRLVNSIRKPGGTQGARAAAVSGLMIDLSFR